MGSERLARRGQVAEALKARTKCMSLIPSTNGRYQRVFSRAGSESKLHFKSLLWNLCEKWLEEDKLPQAPRHVAVVAGLGWGHLEKWIDRSELKQWAYHASVIWGLWFQEGRAKWSPVWGEGSEWSFSPRWGDRGGIDWGLEWPRVLFGPLWVGPIKTFKCWCQVAC